MVYIACCNNVTIGIDILKFYTSITSNFALLNNNNNFFGVDIIINRFSTSVYNTMI